MQSETTRKKGASFKKAPFCFGFLWSADVFCLGKAFKDYAVRPQKAVFHYLINSK
jgi:hypothetical protein